MAGERGWLNWVVLGFVAYAAVASYLVVPRSLVPRLVERGEENRVIFVLFVLWALASAPFLIGLGGFAFGGDVWPMTFALSASIAMHFVNAWTVASRQLPAP